MEILAAKKRGILGYGLFLVCCFLCSSPLLAKEHFPSFLNLDRTVEQVIEVNEDASGGFKAQLQAWERQSDGSFKSVLGPVAVVLGREGFALPGDKREGDGKTPSGVFALGKAFGYNLTIKTKLDYTQVDENDFWVDDAASIQYNQWVRDTPEANSFERLKRDDDLYAAAVVIEYNTNPIVAGHGSAIFMHIYRGPESPTAGCVAMEKEDLYTILEWLDKDKNPVIILGED